MYYDKNRRVLAKTPFHNGMLEELDKTEPTQDVELAQTEAGDFSLIYKGIPLHSLAGAEAEANALVAQHIRKESKTQHFLLGIGLGYVLQALHMDAPGCIWLYEPDLPLLRFVLENVDLSEYLGDRVIIASDNRTLRKLISDCYHFGDTVDVVYTEGYAALWGEELPRVVREEILKMISNKRACLGTIFSYLKDWNKQVMANTKFFPHTEPFTVVKDYFKDKPAIIVSAGPSLDKAIEDIRAIQDKAVIIAVGTAYRPLIDRGITPDFVVFMDFAGLDKQINGIENTLKDTNIILSPFADPACYTPPANRRFLVHLANYPEYTMWTEKIIGKIAAPMNSGGTVSMMAFKIAMALGCKPMILVGQDLAVSGTQLYAGGIGGKIDEKGALIVDESDQVIAKELPLYNIKGQDDTIVKSPRDYIRYIEEFVEAARQFRQDDPDFRPYNASVGGAYLEGFEHKSLADIRKEINFETFDKTLPTFQDDGEQLSVEEKRKRCIKELEIAISVIKDCIKISQDARKHLVFLKQGISNVDGTSHEQRYLRNHRQFLIRLQHHPLLLYFLQRESWVLHKDGNLESQEMQDIIANYETEDLFHDSAQRTFEYALPTMEETLEMIKNEIRVAQPAK